MVYRRLALPERTFARRCQALESARLPPNGGLRLQKRGSGGAGRRHYLRETWWMDWSDADADCSGEVSVAILCGTYQQHERAGRNQNKYDLTLLAIAMVYCFMRQAHCNAQTVSICPGDGIRRPGRSKTSIILDSTPVRSLFASCFFVSLDFNPSPASEWRRRQRQRTCE